MKKKSRKKSRKKMKEKMKTKSRKKFKIKRGRDGGAVQRGNVSHKSRKIKQSSSPQDPRSCIPHLSLPFDHFAELHPGAARIIYDIMYNYTTAFVGTYMRDIVNANSTNGEVVVLPRIKRTDGTGLSTLLAQTQGKPSTLTPSLNHNLVNYTKALITDALNTNRFRGFLIPTGDNNDDVHWKYFKRNGIVCDPAILGMQQRGSQQYCQAHSLRMALDESACTSGHTIAGAYEALLPYFEKIFLTQFVPIRQILVDAITEGVNKEPPADSACAKKYIAKQICPNSINPDALPSVNIDDNDFKTFHCALIKILNSDYAKINLQKIK